MTTKDIDNNANFPKYINVLESNVLWTYMRYGDTVKNNDGTITAKYYAPSAFSAYCGCVNVTKYDSHYMVTNNYDKAVSSYVKLAETTALRFLRKSASFVDMPNNRSLIDEAWNDVPNYIKTILNLRLVEDDPIHGLPSKLIEPLATINCKLVDLEKYLNKFI